MVRLLPGPAEIVDEAPVGRLYKDGRLVLAREDDAIAQRRKLSFVGAVAVSIGLDDGGDLVADPKVWLFGVPIADGRATPFDEIVREAAYSALDGIPRPRRKDASVVAEAVRRAIRAAIGQAWGKRPVCSVQVTQV
jgi:ribonuclease J